MATRVTEEVRQRCQEFKDTVMELLDLPPVPISEKDIEEILQAEAKIRAESLPERIRKIAACFNRSEKTVRAWHNQGLPLADMVAVVRWVTWKQTRRRNKPHPDCRPRLVRSPFD